MYKNGTMEDTVLPNISSLFNQEEKIGEYFKNIIRNERYELKYIKKDYTNEQIKSMTFFDIVSSYNIGNVYKSVRILNCQYFKTLLIDCLNELDGEQNVEG